MSTVSWDDIIPDSDRAEELFAVFGLTVFESAALEESIVLLMAVSALADRSQRGSGELRTLMTSKRRQTMGTLLKEVRRTRLIPAEVIDRFDDALRDRNWLVHHFHRDAFPQIVSPAGLVALVARLHEMRERFVDAGSVAHALVEERLSAHGVNPTEIERDTKALLLQVKQDWAGA
jgi:hypothetical protein